MTYPQYTEQQPWQGSWLQPQYPPQHCQVLQPVPDVSDALLQRVGHIVEACMATMVASNQIFQHQILQKMANLTETVADVQLSQKNIADALININSNLISPQRKANSSSSSSALSSPGSTGGMDASTFVDICPFPQCVATPTLKRCSAAHSLQHMQTCTNLPDGASATARYLSIAEHMLLFAKQPRVSKENTCCWCGGGLPDAEWNPDAKSRHRKSCHRVAIAALKNADSKVADAMQRQLEQTWKIDIEGSPRKKPRIEFEAGLAPVYEQVVGQTTLFADSCFLN